MADTTATSAAGRGSKPDMVKVRPEPPLPCETALAKIPNDDAPARPTLRGGRAGVQLVSAEGFEFYIDRRCAMVSGIMRRMLEGTALRRCTAVGMLRALSRSPR